MPSKNSIKQYAPHSYYHVYNRGLDKQDIFRDTQDYRFFLKLLGKYLDSSYTRTPREIPRPSLASSIELVAFCLMPNHLHILLYQLDDEKALEKLFRSVMTGYVMYFNQKYKRFGPLFQGRYKASLIDSDAYLYHISRYIHLNPLDIEKSYEDYPYSSYSLYKLPKQPTFIKTSRVLNLFDGDYTTYVKSYEELFKKRVRSDPWLDASGLS